MTCGGCSGAVQRILGRVEGIDEVKTDIEAKRVIVVGTVDKDVVLEKLKPWATASGKELSYVGPA